MALSALTQHRESLLGVGVYTPSEAARITRVSAGRIKRWLSGYAFKSSDGAHASPPLWPPEIPSTDSLVLSFRDLLEVRFVDAFRQHGVGWKSIRIAAEHAGPIDVLVTDVGLPRMDGRELAARLVAVRPGVKVVFTSGYSRTALFGEAGPTGAVYVQKPYSAAALTRLVSALSGTEPGANQQSSTAREPRREPGDTACLEK